jgi:hypothetical protein
MDLKELSEAVSGNLWKQLLDTITSLFKFQPEQKPRVIRTEQFFDNKTGEHVIVLQYRVRLPNQAPLAQHRRVIQHKDTKKK